MKGKDVKIFATTFEYEAYDQIKALCNYEPYKDAKIRIMPDAHAGKGCTVGTTMTISDKITPNLVGVDIGCGMLVVAISNKWLKNAESLKSLDEAINKHIPNGFNIHYKAKGKFDFDRLKCASSVDTTRALYSIGSLGGGNHFIELATTDYYEDRCFLIIHSGSRKLGGDVCKHYQDLAFQSLNEMGRIKDSLIKKLKSEGRYRDIDSELKKLQKPKCSKELAHLEGVNFDNYCNDMQVAQEYASLNRHTMANILIKELGMQEISRFETIHNYIDFDNMIMRKGAVSAQNGEVLLIPINMRDGSLLCVGKGNQDWNCSAPHGAGRLYSRSKAKEMFDISQFESEMEGIYTTSVCQSTIDEMPSVYKPMSEIIECIEPTVDVLCVLKPVYNFKAK